MRYQQQAVIIIIALGSTIHAVEGLLVGQGCSSPPRTRARRLRSFPFQIHHPHPKWPRIISHTTSSASINNGGGGSIYSSREEEVEGNSGDISNPDPNTSGNEQKTRASRSKYILSSNTTFGDIEEEGLYWNTAAPVTKKVTVVSPESAPTSSSSSSNNKTTTPSTSTDEKNTMKSDIANNLGKSESAASVSPIPAPKTTPTPSRRYDLGIGKNTPIEYLRQTKENDPKQWLTNTKEGQFLSRACVVYDTTSTSDSNSNQSNDKNVVLEDGGNKEVELDMENNGIGKDQMAEQMTNAQSAVNTNSNGTIEDNDLKYEDIDQSIPLSVYDAENGIDLVWSLLRTEAKIEAQREPLLVSFLYSTILNHPSLESALAFHLANRLASTSMDSIQVMNIILEALEKSPTFRRDLRADIVAVRDRDPACAALPDVFLHFKGFHALQSYRVANYLWTSGRKTLAHYFQSQMSQNFQIDIHPKATLKSGIMIDHGTGVVIGETAVVGYNCSILHHVTLGGSGKRGVIRHPNIGDGALLGAGATILGNVHVGKGCQVGAGTLVIDDLPDHSVAVGVPAKIIGTYKAQEAQPSRTMNQVGSKESEMTIIPFII